MLARDLKDVFLGPQNETLNWRISMGIRGNSGSFLELPILGDRGAPKWHAKSVDFNGVCHHGALKMAYEIGGF